jgi:hypothetical protein
MRLLLDTHTFLWFVLNDRQRSEIAVNLIGDRPPPICDRGFCLTIDTFCFSDRLWNFSVDTFWFSDRL